MRDMGFDLQHSGRGVAVVVFDEPFVAFEFLPRGFLRPHAFWFGLCAGDGGSVAAGGRRVGSYGTGGDCGVGAEGRIFVGLRGGVDFSELGGDGFAFGDLVEDGTHVGWIAGGGDAVGWHGWWRWGITEVGKWWRRWRASGRGLRRW